MLWKNKDDLRAYSTMREEAIERALSTIVPAYPIPSEGKIKEKATSIIFDNNTKTIILPELHEYARYPDSNEINILSPIVSGICNGDQNNQNTRTVNLLHLNSNLLQSFIAVCEFTNESLNNIDVIDEALQRYNNADKNFAYHDCEPTYAQVDAAFNLWASLYRNAVNAHVSAVSKLFANAERELGNSEWLLVQSAAGSLSI